MRTGAAVVTHALLAPGVVVFAWVSDDDHGDGLLVDVDIATARWREVADVLVRSSSVRPADWWITIPVRDADGHTIGCVGDWSTVLAVVVALYRATLARRGGERPARDVRSSPARRPGSA